jgi:hypothetical protein
MTMRPEEKSQPKQEKGYYGVNKQRTDKWRFKSHRSNHEKITDLWLYPELDCSACIDDDECEEEEGPGQLRYYCDYIQRRYPQWWEADAVPIYWTVMGSGDAFGCETAPCRTNLGLGLHEDFLTHYHTPIHVETGEPLNWFKLPVINSRYPKFARALGWLPSPFQDTAPLRSITRGIEDIGRFVRLPLR